MTGDFIAFFQAKGRKQDARSRRSAGQICNQTLSALYTPPPPHLSNIQQTPSLEKVFSGGTGRGGEGGSRRAPPKFRSNMFFKVTFVSEC